MPGNQKPRRRKHRGTQTGSISRSQPVAPAQPPGGDGAGRAASQEGKSAPSTAATAADVARGDDPRRLLRGAADPGLAALRPAARLGRDRPHPDRRGLLHPARLLHRELLLPAPPAEARQERGEAQAEKAQAAAERAWTSAHSPSARSPRTPTSSAATAPTEALIIDPGDEAPRLLAAIDELGLDLEAILLTHTHFDHVGAVAPVARETGAPVYCPEIEVPVLADIMSFVPWPGFGPFESYDADETVNGGEQLELAGFEIDVLFTPGHSPGHVTYVVPDEAGDLFSGDVLFQGSVGRVDLPGGDWPTLLRMRACSRTHPARDDPSTRATWGSPRWGRSARATRSWRNISRAAFTSPSPTS